MNYSLQQHRKLFRNIFYINNVIQCSLSISKIMFWVTVKELPIAGQE